MYIYIHIYIYSSFPPIEKHSLAAKCHSQNCQRTLILLFYLPVLLVPWGDGKDLASTAQCFVALLSGKFRTSVLVCQRDVRI